MGHLRDEGKDVKGPGDIVAALAKNQSICKSL